MTNNKKLKTNPFFDLKYETALESLGNEYFDRVQPANFSQHILRFRNDKLLPILGLDPATVSDQHFIDFGSRFKGDQSCLALRYHGYQFGQYNPYLGDGRGFLYGQVRGIDGGLYDFGTKGSGQTPHSQSRDGRLTLKGGVREVLAAEALHNAGVKTSRCLSLIETEAFTRDGAKIRGAVMVRFSRSHL
ncbi:MAG: protein adenylyltransferase SelO family protein, partial [Cyanobacteria bacterium P01_A01_bin.83]